MRGMIWRILEKFGWKREKKKSEINTEKPKHVNISSQANKREEPEKSIQPSETKRDFKKTRWEKVHVFISHTEKDAEVALEIALSLEKVGYMTWCYELDSIPGPSYLVQTGQAIDKAQSVILIISPHSLGSRQVTSEVVRAHERGKYFIPILRDITHIEFQNRKLEWREAVGAATSICIPQEGVADIHACIIAGLKALGIQPMSRPDAARIDQIAIMLDELRSSIASGGPLQPPKEFFIEFVQECFELNQYVAQEAAKAGKPHREVAKAVQEWIDAQRVQGEKAFAAGDQKAYSDSIMMLENIRNHIIGMAQKMIKFEDTRTDMERAADHVKIAEAEASKVNLFAASQNRKDLQDETEQIKNQLNQLAKEAQKNPRAVQEKVAQLWVRLEQIKNVLMGKSESFREEGQRLTSWRGSGNPEIPDGMVDQVHFTVTSPSLVRPSDSFVVDIWAHLERQREEVIRRAREEFGGSEIRIKSKGPVEVARGSVLSVRLKLEDLVVENSEDTILWNNEIGNATFLVTVPRSVTEGPKSGLATIHVNGLQIARIYFIIQVGKTLSDVNHIPTQQERNRKAFASYASADRDNVLARVQGIQKVAPNLHIFLDVVSLRSGQYWEQELWKVIPSNDVFYLFWSRNAAKSQWVEKEWRCALKTRGLDFIDPVPLVSPEEVPPPPELASKHFNDWVLAYMRGKRQ